MSFVELRNVRKVFRNRLTPHGPTVALRLEELRVEEGEKVALTGPSGCGKSTLLNLISGISRPSEGVVSVAGERIDRLTSGRLDRFRGKNIGYVFQEFNLVGALSALDNVMLGLRFGRSIPRIQWPYRAREMLDRVGLGHRRKSRPDQLSIGEQQRVAIARAVVNHPPLVLADEPTGSLDPSTGSQVFELLLDVCSEGTHALLVVTHDRGIANRLPRTFDCVDLIHESDGRQ